MDNEDYEPLLAELGVGYYDQSGNFQYGIETYHEALEFEEAIAACQWFEDDGYDPLEQS